MIRVALNHNVVQRARRWESLMISPRAIVNALSLSRVLMGFLFLVCFQKQVELFNISLAVCLVALAADILDGYVARRLRIDSVKGRLWDSLGDKSFYAAILIAFTAQGFLSPLVCWGLIVREIALYITRILYIHNLSKIERIRPSTNWHGYFMYLTIVLGILRMHVDVHGLSFQLGPYMQVSACAALAFGIFSIFHFIKLR